MPRPRFTLRVALAVTAIVAVVAWQVGAVMQRRWAMKSGPIFILAREAPGDPSPERRTVNFFRAYLGDEPVRFIYVEPKGDAEQTIAGLKRLFPEAQIVAGY
jgi:hypothetical protein